MKLSSTITDKSILFDLDAENKTSAIKELLNHCINLDILSSAIKLNVYLNEKEKSFNSAVGRGIAYHYNTSVEVNDIVAILGVSKNGIDYNANDGLLCNFILLILEPTEESTQHRKLINLFQTMINDPTIKSKIIESKNPNEIIDVIQEWETIQLDDTLV